MSWKCQIFGHKQESGWAGRKTYGRIKKGPIDGLETMHCQVVARCGRCEKEFEVIKIHIPANAVTNIFDKTDQVILREKQ